MRIYQFSLQLSAFLAGIPPVFAHPTSLARSVDPDIQWAPCRFNGTLPGECGRMMAPLDYTDDKSQAKVEIELLRFPASRMPREGSIFLNFGGPGGSGIEDMAAFAERIQVVTGGHYDLVNVIPRGTNNTLSFSCYGDPSSRMIGEQNLAGNVSNIALGQAWAKATIFTENCAVLQNETGRFIGTAFTARDTMRAVDALEEDKMLRFWGFSYGTLLGQTLMAMFPNRIDKLILDGVVNPFEYYQNTESELVSSIDDVFRGFCEGCVAARDACPLAGNMTATQLEDSLYAQLQALKSNPIPLSDPSIPGGGILIDYSVVKGFVLPKLNFPSNWPQLAQSIAALATGSAAGLASGSVNTMASSAASDGTDAESQFGIKCSDVLQHAESVADLLPTIEARRRLSRFGGDAFDQNLARCAQWKLPAKERYSGDFGSVTTQNPIFIINNRFDPVTPLASARNASQTYAGSVLLEQVSYGHISMSQGSLCTAKAVMAYFTQGKLPERGTICDDVKYPLFSGETGWDDIVRELNSTRT